MAKKKTSGKKKASSPDRNQQEKSRQENQVVGDNVDANEADTDSPGNYTTDANIRRDEGLSNDDNNVVSDDDDVSRDGRNDAGDISSPR